MKLDELYFGVKLHPLSWGSRDERKQLRTYNLFDLSRVKESIAIYRTTPKDKKDFISDPLHFCFGDVWGRTEYEFIVCPWPYSEQEMVSDNGIKVDTFEMYVKPNRDYLMSLVDQVDEEDCKKYLAEVRKRRRG